MKDQTKTPNAIKRNPGSDQPGLFDLSHSGPLNLFDSKDLWVSSPVSAFDSLLKSKGYAKSTYTVYSAMFNAFCAWMKERGLTLFICTDGDINQFLNAIETDQGRTRNRRQYLRILEDVFRHLREVSKDEPLGIDHYGIHNVDMRDTKDKDTRFLKENEVNKVIKGIQSKYALLLASANPRQEWIDFRDLAMVCLVFGAGLKVGNLAGLTLNCIDTQENRIELSRAKYTHRARILSFAVDPIASWCRLLRSLDMPGLNALRDPPVVIADNKKGFARASKTFSLDASGINRRVSKFLKELGIVGDRAGPQTLRNAYAGMLIDGGATNEELIDFLGIRASLHANRLREKYAKFKNIDLS